VNITEEEARAIVRNAIQCGWAHMPDARGTIHGAKITREEAVAGLGDESKWAEEAAKVKAEFQRRP